FETQRSLPVDPKFERLVVRRANKVYTRRGTGVSGESPAPASASATCGGDLDVIAAGCERDVGSSGQRDRVLHSVQALADLAGRDLRGGQGAINYGSVGNRAGSERAAVGRRQPGPRAAERGGRDRAADVQGCRGIVFADAHVPGRANEKLIVRRGGK